METSEPGEIQEDTPPSRRSLQQLGGSLDHKVNGFLVGQALNTLWFANDDPQLREYILSVIFALTADIAPRNGLEGIMVAQIIATNNVSMKCYMDAMAADSPEKRNDFVNMGTKATRSLNGLIDALCRNRGKERPQVSVGDVSVNQGGQAIVGVTNEPSAAPAARKRAAKRGTRADQPTTPMRSAHPEPETLPVIAGSGEDALPDARRRGGERGTSRQQERRDERPLHGGSDSVEAGSTGAAAPESAVDREPVSAAEQTPPAERDCDKASEWSGAPIKEHSGPAFFPQVDLFWAIQPLADLHKRAKRQPVSIDELATAWYLDPDGTEMVDTIEALLAYGFLEHSGQGSERRFRVSELGQRVREPPDDNVHRQGMLEAALKPALLAAYLERWSAGRPEDDICIAELKAEHGFTENQAKHFIRVFEEANFWTREPKPYEAAEPSPQVATRRRRFDPAQNPWTKWDPEIEAFREAA